MTKPDAASERWVEQWTEQWAERVHRSGLEVVALPVLEIGRGLGFLASHALLFVQPLLAGLVNEARIEQYVTLLEDTSTWESLIDRIERKAEGDG